MGYQAGGPLDVVAFYLVRCAKKLGHLEENHPSNSNLQKSTDCQKRCGLNDIVTLLVTFGHTNLFQTKEVVHRNPPEGFLLVAVFDPLRQVIKVIKVIKVKDEHDPESPHSVLAKFKVPPTVFQFGS